MSELKKNIKTQFAKSFLEEFRKENSYLFISDIDANSNVDIPVQPKDTLFEENEAKKSILCAYQLYDNDVNLGIKRINWQSGTIYQEFSDKEELLNFYVLNIVNNRYRVYKCLNNNNNSASTVPPTGTNTEEEYKTGDKYVWKFMFEIPDILYKFITDDYIPVPVLDDLIFTDERYLQSAVQSSAKSGTIEEINFSYSETNTQNFQVYDIISENYENPNAIVAGSTPNEQTQEITLSISLSSVENPLFLNPNDGYYNDNYFMMFNTEQEGVIVTTIKSYTINENNENLATIELCDINGNVSNIDVGTPYSIVPKIIVRGDGDDNVIAIPIFENRELVDIEMISAGTNYIKAEAYFLIDSPYVLNPIISPNKGHGSEASSELYANAVIISKVLNKHTENVSSANKYYFGHGNDIHQFGIISNLKTKNNVSLEKMLPINRLSLIKTNSTVIITINNYTNNDNFFNINDVITRGTAFKKDQFRAKINSITTNTNTILTCELINGLFNNYLTLNLKNETTGKIYTLTNGQFSVNYENLPTFTSYDTANIVLGKESLFTCNVLSVLEENTTSIKYEVENLQKIPQQSYYNSEGDLIKGEPVGLLTNNTDGISVLDDSFLNVLSLESDFSLLTTCYSYILKITVNSKNLELGNNQYIEPGDYLDKYIITKDLLNFGKIVFIEYFNENNNTGVYNNAYIYIKPEKGTFSDFSVDTNRELYIVDTSPYEKSYTLSEFKGFCSSFGPQYEPLSSNLDINSGKILYLNNINTITLNDTQSIEAKIVLEF